MTEAHIDVFEKDEVAAADGFYRDSITGNIPKYDNKENEGLENKLQEIPSLSPEVRLINKKPLGQEATTYRLEEFEKKVLYIFNQVNVAGYKERKGSEEDELRLNKVFKNLGFDIKLCPDLKLEKIFEVLNEMKSKDFSDYGCIGIVIMTHGNKDGKLMAADRPYLEGDVLTYFKSNVNPSLVTKPKFLIIQACRGQDPSQSIEVLSENSKLRKDHAEEVRPYTLPVESDILVLHSSYYGQYSLIDEEKGSWFIQTLCSVIEEYHIYYHLEEIMKLVIREVSKKEYVIKNRQSNEQQIEKQLPIMTSTLTRNLFIRKYELNESESDKTILVLENKSDALNNSKDVNELELHQDCQQNFSRDDKEQGETKNIKKDEIDHPKLSCQCDRVRTNYFNHKYAYVKHNTQLYINHNDDAYCAKMVFESVKTCENDDRFQKDQLSNMLELLIKNKKISCRECNIDVTFKFH